MAKGDICREMPLSAFSPGRLRAAVSAPSGSSVKRSAQRPVGCRVSPEFAIFPSGLSASAASERPSTRRKDKVGLHDARRDGDGQRHGLQRENSNSERRAASGERRDRSVSGDVKGVFMDGIFHSDHVLAPSSSRRVDRHMSGVQSEAKISTHLSR